MTTAANRPFGRLITAMVTPFNLDGTLDIPGAQRLATYLVDDQHNDALVINGTTGESPTTSNEEKENLLRAVVDAVGDRAKIIAGVGTFDTQHTVELARTAEKAGANGLLVVSPYYSKPPQTGLLRHFTTVADASELPILLYDIPHRTGTTLQTDTIIKLAEHPRIVGMKDAKGDLVATSWVLQRSDLAYYSGDDALTLPMLAVGGVGLVGTSTHLSGVGTKAMIESFERGDHAGALRRHRQLLPIFTGIFRTQGCILVKAAMNARGLPAGPVRSPLVDATGEELAALRADCVAADIDL